MVPNPRLTPNAIKQSIREIPVTISAFISGILFIPITIVLGTFFMLLIPMHATVPIMVAISADRNAMIRVFHKADMIRLLLNSCSYHFRLKPSHWDIYFELLNDRIISATIGTYRKIKIPTR